MSADPRVVPAAKALYEWLSSDDLQLVWEDWPVEHPRFEAAVLVVLAAADAVGIARAPGSDGCQG